MSWIDLTLLNLTEKGCQAFQRLTGRSNVWVAFQLTNLSIVVYFVWAAVYVWVTRGVTRVLLGVFSTALLWALSQTLFRASLEGLEESAYRRVAKGLRNPRRLRDAMLRIPFLTLSIVLLAPVLFVYANLRLTIVLLVYSLVVLTTAVLYLLACDPLPPCRGTVVEWLRSWRAESPRPTHRLPTDETLGGRPRVRFLRGPRQLLPRGQRFDERDADRLSGVARHLARAGGRMAATAVLQTQFANVDLGRASEDRLADGEHRVLAAESPQQVHRDIALRIERIHHEAVAGVDRILAAQIDDHRVAVDPGAAPQLRFELGRVGTIEIDAFLDVRKLQDFARSCAAGRSRSGASSAGSSIPGSS